MDTKPDLCTNGCMNVRSQFDCPPQQYFFHKQVGLIITLFNYFCKHFVIYDTPEEIIKNPGNGFVREFILKQLEIKKNNIYSLFTVPKNIPGVAAGKVQEILTGREELVQVS